MLELIACKTCRSRKRPCDKAAPRCAQCVRSDVPCVFADAGEEISRQQIAELEARAATLRAELQGASSPRPSIQGDGGGGGIVTEDTGPSQGSNVLEAILSHPQFQSRRLGQLLARAPIEQPDAAPTGMPEQQVAEIIFANYLQESHIQRPMMLESEVMALLHRAYSNGQPTQLCDQDAYTFLMLCAISAVRLRRKNMIAQHPYSFFLTAQKHAEHVNLLSGVVALQNLLLVARFGVYFHTGVSTWEIGRICMHICVELELHLKPLTRLCTNEEQHRRILFWESYITDRHTSTILGRPFAIADVDIEVDLPSAACEFGEQSLLSGVNSQDLDRDSQLSVFNAFVRLRQISSKIHSAFVSKSKSTMPHDALYDKAAFLGDLLDKYHDLSDHITRWRHSCPVYDNAETFYQMQEWYDFLAEKETLFLVRGALDALQSQTAMRPKDLCDACCCAATKSFNYMRRSGLLLAFFSSNQPEQALSAAENYDNSDVVETLLQCHGLLQDLCNEMRDASPYASVFGLICDAAYPEWKSRDLQRREQGMQGLYAAQDSLYLADSASLHGLDQFDVSREEQYAWLDPTEDWSYSPGHLFADMEAYVGQFATGDFTWDQVMDSTSINMSFEGMN